ncbi:LysE family translocator [Novispirillum sp. DQ9]|uniref:LysE family translocator n=1 Tax=Novispirillum sp. DQ9 TaxID=3398612 RepID=UPI003C7AB52A
MDAVTFTAAALALLATPGPTNTLLAASGATAGMRSSLRLVPAEIAGYMVSITLLKVLLGPAADANLALTIGLKLAASAWLAVCAVRLWRQAGTGFSDSETPVTLRRVFVTTLSNPKALIFALVIVPPGGLSAALPWLAGLSGLIALTAVTWIALGATLARSAGTLVTPRRIWRASALALAAFATMAAGSALAAMG